MRNLSLDQLVSLRIHGIAAGTSNRAYRALDNYTATRGCAGGCENGYSARRACIGSSRVALNAGTAEASNAAPASTNGTATKLNGS